MRRSGHLKAMRYEAYSSVEQIDRLEAFGERYALLCAVTMDQVFSNR